MNEGTYLLFNPYIFKWVTIDEIGKDILQSIILHNNLNVVKNYIINKYNITKDIYENDAVPYINDLVKKGFLCTRLGSSEKKDVIDNCLYSPDNTVLESMYLSLEEGCNLNCIYCFNKENRRKRINDNALSLDEIKSCLKQYKELGGQGVVLTGGEPTLNKNFMTICSYAKDMGLIVSVITNGTYLNSFDINDIVNNIDNLSISIDSVDDSEQKLLWKTNGFSYNENVRPFLKKYNEFATVYHKNLEITIMPVLTSINLATLKQTVNEISKELNNVNVRWVITKYGNIGVNEIDELLSISNYEYDKAIWDSMSENVENDSLKQFVLSKGGKDPITFLPHKVLCNPSFFITYYGDVYPCQGLENQDFYLGNIRYNTLDKILNNDLFNNLKKALYIDNVSYCKDCELRTVCTNINGRPCNKTFDQNCKADIVYRLYMMTQKVNQNN
ncbi:MAG: radical SAM protein [Eubacterium sp.]|nr:radical SAM protein [Eubacterium sp.]